MKPGYFEETLLLSLPSDTVQAMAVLTNEAARLANSIRAAGNNMENLIRSHDDFVEASSILRAFMKSREIEPKQWPAVGAHKEQNVQNLIQHFGSLATMYTQMVAEQQTIGLMKSKTDHYEAVFDKVPMYVFSEQDFAEIQRLINELRGLITESQLITAHHKQRLLRRLEAMQGELHRKTSDIDRFWGFIGEAGVVARKFGEDLQPITDRVTTLGRVVIATILTAEGIKALPEVVKILEHLK